MELEGMHEADILINGKALSLAQSMAVRVAIGSFLMSVTNPDYAHEMGPIAGNYADRLLEVHALLFNLTPGRP